MTTARQPSAATSWRSRATPSSLRRTAAAYFVFQAVAASGWWVVLLGSTSFRRLYLPPGAPDVMLTSLWVADALLYIGASAAVAVGLALQRTWWSWVFMVHVGAASYAGMNSLTLAVSAGCCWLGPALMLPALALALAAGGAAAAGTAGLRD